MKRKVRVGLYTTGLKAYWPQFKGLRERLEGYGKFIASELAAESDMFDVMNRNAEIIMANMVRKTRIRIITTPRSLFGNTCFMVSS